MNQRPDARHNPSTLYSNETAAPRRVWLILAAVGIVLVGLSLGWGIRSAVEALGLAEQNATRLEALELQQPAPRPFELKPPPAPSPGPRVR